MRPVDDGIFPSTFYKTISALLSDCKRNGSPATKLFVARCGHPVCVPRSQLKARPVPEPELQRMEPGVWRLRTEAQDIVIWRVVGDGYQMLAEGCCVLEGEVLSARELRDGLGHIALESIGRSEVRHPPQP